MVKKDLSGESWGTVELKKYPSCEEERAVSLVETPTNARVQRQESAWSVVGKGESGLWKKWIHDLG